MSRIKLAGSCEQFWSQVCLRSSTVLEDECMWTVDSSLCRFGKVKDENVRLIINITLIAVIYRRIKSLIL
ncbi:hypothetical protein KIN20_008233 [Parelaphostrongylus tenuis]|uniref:Uncharacterized protein n=1 Tax=Parelaphostrongylus tenuis TaxID=148309 RepID=A0AAD5QMK5_PARTN|nr:hypothetical protein KIN20_008233 [Parelaphostrongylus tenuis]